MDKIGQRSLVHHGKREKRSDSGKSKYSLIIINLRRKVLLNPSNKSSRVVTKREKGEKELNK